MPTVRRSQPLVLGEFGGFRRVQKDVADAVGAARQIRAAARQAGMRGSVFWTYDAVEQPELFNAREADGAIFNSLQYGLR